MLAVAPQPSMVCRKVSGSARPAEQTGQHAGWGTRRQSSMICSRV
jgi:hypothetical protein